METKIRIAELVIEATCEASALLPPPEALAFLGRVHALDLSSTEPGTVRGHHYHLRRRDIVVLPSAAWSMPWDEGLDTLRRRSMGDLMVKRQFSCWGRRTRCVIRG